MDFQKCKMTAEHLKTNNGKNLPFSLIATVPHAMV